MPYVGVRDLEIYYELSGEGPRLLFIGGTGGDLRQKPSLSDGPLTQNFELLAYDQRGLGRTSKPDGPYSMADYGDDAAALLDALGWEQAAVVGVSFGGMVAQHLALRHPDRVSRMALACTSSGGEGGASYPLHELMDLPPEEAARIGIEIADTRMDAAWREREPEAFANIVKMMAGREVKLEDDAERKDAQRGARLQLEARRDHDTWDGLPSIRVPTYLCGGQYDGIAPPANLEAMASRLPDCKLEFFDGGHLFLMQDRRAFSALVAFLKG